jgi:hypothetical protein
MLVALLAATVTYIVCFESFLQRHHRYTVLHGAGQPSLFIVAILHKHAAACLVKQPSGVGWKVRVGE